jgi:hypothetical protein
MMGWAGAMEGIFRTFADDFSALPLNLYQNFRSLRPAISSRQHPRAAHHSHWPSYP